jgi:hypothetical protein
VGQFFPNGDIQIPMASVQLANPRFNRHTYASSAQRDDDGAAEAGCPFTSCYQLARLWLYTHSALWLGEITPNTGSRVPDWTPAGAFMTEVEDQSPGLNGDLAQSALTDTAEVRGLKVRLGELREEHRALDAAIAAMQDAAGDGLQLARLKKRKLSLRDQIQWIEDQLMPDIIA